MLQGRRGRTVLRPDSTSSSVVLPLPDGPICARAAQPGPSSAQCRGRDGHSGTGAAHQRSHLPGFEHTGHVLQQHCFFGLVHQGGDRVGDVLRGAHVWRQCSSAAARAARPARSARSRTLNVTRMPSERKASTEAEGCMPPASTSPAAGAALERESRAFMALIAVRARRQAPWLQRGAEGGESDPRPRGCRPRCEGHRWKAGNLKRDQAQNGSGDRGTICDRDERAGRACTARSLTCCRPTSAARAETLPPPRSPGVRARGDVSSCDDQRARRGELCTGAGAWLSSSQSSSSSSRCGSGASSLLCCPAAACGHRERVRQGREPAAPRSGASPLLDAHAAPALSKSVRGAAVNLCRAMQMRISLL